MKINRFFEKTLGANLKNSRWSWGATDPLTNRVFLRLWEDHITQEGSIKKVQVFWKTPSSKSAGYAERLAQIEAIKNGAQGLGVVCRAVDPLTPGIRQIADFDESPLLKLGDFTEDQSFIYFRILGQIPLSELERKPSAQSTLAKDIRTILSTRAFEATTKEALINARLGQGAFRSAVLEQWNHRCSVTSSKTLDAIRASHIKPWRDSTNAQRLDPKNGLPLVASLDALFDVGLISFDARGTMLVSSEMNEQERIIYDLAGRKLTQLPEMETVQYLEYHRDNIYRK
jgi:hypothetical protein